MNASYIYIGLSLAVIGIAVFGPAIQRLAKRMDEMEQERKTRVGH